MFPCRKSGIPVRIRHSIESLGVSAPERRAVGGNFRRTAKMLQSKLLNGFGCRNPIGKIFTSKNEERVSERVMKEGVAWLKFGSPRKLLDGFSRLPPGKKPEAETIGRLRIIGLQAVRRVPLGFRFVVSVERPESLRDASFRPDRAGVFP